jgi:hypothetical protein
LVEDQRERVLAGRVCLGLPLSLDSKLKTTRGKGFEDVLKTRERSQQIPFPPLGRFCKRNRRERDMERLG